MFSLVVNDVPYFNWICAVYVMVTLSVAGCGCLRMAMDICCFHLRIKRNVDGFIYRVVREMSVKWRKVSLNVHPGNLLCRRSFVSVSVACQPWKQGDIFDGRIKFR